MTNPNIRFMTNNLITSLNYTSSSANVTYPVANVLNTNRDKYWTSAGYFLINSTNNKIYINDGADKTATITSAGYTSGTSLATAIQTALNAVSTLWTCTYDVTYGTYKFHIERSGGGTATLRLSQTTNAAWDTMGFTGAADIDGTDVNADEQRNHTSEWFRIDLGVETEVKFIGAIGPIDEILDVSNQATIRLMANNVDDWTAPAFTQTITNSQKGLLCFLDDATDTVYRFWKFEIIDRKNGIGPGIFKIGYIYIGGYDTITSSNVQRGLSRQIIDPSVRFDSESGKRYFDTRLQYEEFNDIAIANMTAADKAIVEQIGYDYSNREPLFVSIDPLLSISTDLNEYTKFVYFNNTPRVNHLFLNYYTMSMSFSEVI